MSNYRKSLFSIIIIISIIFICQNAFALSEYGLRCEDNKKCVKCINDIDCIKCMHRCWNIYGHADSDIKDSSVHSNEEKCQQKRAKWCNAQCWDPDDTKVPNYISTKPECNANSYYSYEGIEKSSKNKPGY